MRINYLRNEEFPCLYSTSHRGYSGSLKQNFDFVVANFQCEVLLRFSALGW